MIHPLHQFGKRPPDRAIDASALHLFQGGDCSIEECGVALYAYFFQQLSPRSQTGGPGDDERAWHCLILETIRMAEIEQARQRDALLYPVKRATLICIDLDIKSMFCFLLICQQKRRVTAQGLPPPEDRVRLHPGLLE